MTKTVMPDDSRPFDPALEDLSTYLARIRAAKRNRSCPSLTIAGAKPGVLAVLKALEDIYQTKP